MFVLQGRDGRGLSHVTFEPLDPISFVCTRRIAVAGMDVDVDITVEYPAIGRDDASRTPTELPTPAQLGSEDQQVRM